MVKWRLNKKKEEPWRKTESMQDQRQKKRRPKRVGRLGRLLAGLPADWPVLYPLYLAAQLDTVEDTFSSAALPEAFDGMKVAFLSDIHYGALFGEARVRDLAERVNALEADVVLLGGDYGENAEGAVEFFRLRPGFRAKTAVLAAFGNHDRTEPDSALTLLKAAMRADGAVPVLNEAFIVCRGGKKLAFASADDCFCGEPDLKRVEKQCRDADFTVFFPHNPDLLPFSYIACGRPFFQLALCGHTHGGQVAVFGRSIRYSSETGRRYLSGWFRENGTEILVTNGVGTSGIPVRLGARPQIHLLTLKTKRA